RTRLTRTASLLIEVTAQNGGTMDEKEWLVTDDAERMVSFLMTPAGNARLSERKARLLGVACCHRMWPLLHAALRDAVRFVELHVDGKATDEEMGRSLMDIHRFNQSFPGSAVYLTARFSPHQALRVPRLAADAVAWSSMRRAPVMASPASRLSEPTVR